MLILDNFSNPRGFYERKTGSNKPFLMAVERNIKNVGWLQGNNNIDVNPAGHSIE